MLSMSVTDTSGQPGEPAEKNCRIVRKGLTVPCPPGWALLDESDREAVIANFRQGPGVTKNTRSGHGKATIAVSTMPSNYRSFAEWLYAARKVAPDAVESKIHVETVSGEQVPVVLMSSPEKSGPIYASYFFQSGKVSALIELNFRGEDPRAAEYASAVKSMIASASQNR